MHKQPYRVYVRFNKLRPRSLRKLSEKTGLTYSYLWGLAHRYYQPGAAFLIGALRAFGHKRLRDLFELVDRDDID